MSKKDTIEIKETQAKGKTVSDILEALNGTKKRLTFLDWLTDGLFYKK